MVSSAFGIALSMILTLVLIVNVLTGLDDLATAVAAPAPVADMPSPAPPQLPDDGDAYSGRGGRMRRRVPPPGAVAGSDGRPVRWSCTGTIPVVLEGAAPHGAHAALRLVTKRLREASSLPLIVSDDPLAQDGLGAIRIRYVAQGESAYGMILSGRTVGRGGPSYSVDGLIGSGRVIVRNDMDPTTLKGQQVLMHEIAHALGLLHADEGLPEVMVPAALSDAAPVLGPGDRAALRVVGC